jgi:hypothetical protein
MSSNLKALLRHPLCWFLSLAVPANAHACATCGCALNADAAMGYSASAGWRINLEYDFIDQNQLRSGTSPVSAAQLAAINDAGGSQEVEHQTISRYTTVGVSYRPTADWNVNLLIPYVNRGHTTYSGATTDQLVPDNLSGSATKGLGDVRLIGSYQGFLPAQISGFSSASSCRPATMGGRM